MDAVRKTTDAEGEDGSAWVTLEEARKLLGGESREGVLLLGIEGKLTIERRGRRWVFVSRASIDAYNEARGRREIAAVK
jgi:hypothetical protein